ncbi:TonB-dependent siderophore receptor [Novosphingobium sp. 9]|uniref:TonB-dependent siderophore receptor n=1 Tax=Novosphingobium sp. 9 TaxID=2025349 RepID=UPI0021B5CF4B|nr:TonB-dependent siderophore receptor [Novosphingobium sp. 9]
MKRVLTALATGVATCALTVTAHADDAAATSDTAKKSEESIVVTAPATQDISSATGLPLTIAETPQAVTIVNQQQIKDFSLRNVNDLLDQVPGVNVERAETDRTQYDSRGFTITNFQVDGVGMPLLSGGIAYGSLDTALYDRVEVVRGANGMMTGVGNPSATVNYVRKRPTDTFQASVTGYLGSFDDHRVEADISGPLNSSGTLRARVVGAHEDSDSYLDYYHVNRNVIGAVVAWDVTPDLTATAGYSRQQNNADGVMWGTLPMTYSDGSQISYKRSASTAAPWTYWNTRNQSAFAELKYNLGNDWSVKGTYTFNRIQYKSKLLYAYGYPDPDTGLGISGMTGIYPTDYKQDIYNLDASGPFQLFGRQHQLAFGVSTGRNSGHEYEGFSDTYPDYPAVSEIGNVTIPEPDDYPTPVLQARTIDRITRVYGAIHWNITDRLTAITGASATWLKSTGDSYGVDEARKNSKVTPYVGALYDITHNVKLYASYTGIFNPQSEVNAGNQRLAPATGSSIEAGVKSEWFGGKLYATAALFRAHQKNLAEAAGTFGDDDVGPAGGTYYVGQTTTSKGFEVEIAGKITPNWTVGGGYTGFTLKTPDGERAFTYIPNRTLKLNTTYTIPQLNDLKFGANLRWQDATHIDDSTVQDAEGNDAVVRQGHYAVLDLMAGMTVTKGIKAQIVVDNVTDKKYLNSLAWGQAYYAAPRTVMGSITFSY